uniref:Lipid-binding serum glycoprotein N-terminal domain-containing protein n=1 Tax=Megaselia scalaris TaxID=36166 RepID=T1GY34_MEGSC
MGIMGSYKAKGQIAMFPIESQGEGSVNFTGLDWNLKFVGKPEERNGKTFLKIENLKVKENGIEKCVVYLGNLLGSMTDTLNEFLVDNWKEFYREMNDSVYKSFALFVEDYIQNVFKAHPYEDFFK